MSQSITKRDLQLFKAEILAEIKTLFQNYVPPPYRRWLRSKEVCKLLNISAQTLHQFKRSGTLRYIRIGRIIYYDQDYVHQLFLNNFNQMEFE